MTFRWEYISSLYASGELGEDVSDTQEVLEDMLNRTVTREYLDLLKVALVGGTITDRDHVGLPGSGGAGGGGVTTAGGTDAMEADDQSMDGSPHGVTRASQSALAAEVISELGGKLLRDPKTSTPLVMTILRWDRNLVNKLNCSKINKNTQICAVPSFGTTVRVV